MISSIKPKNLAGYVYSQISLFFPDDSVIELLDIERYVNNALNRTEFCFQHINNKYYSNKNNETLFNHLNGDHYATFLYFLSNIIWQEGGCEKISTKLFLLNKLLHGVDIFYKISMPDIFLLVHPLGTVLGRASYSNYLTVYQGCTIGSVIGGGFPIIRENLIMYSNSSLLGDCRIGSNVTIGANSYAINLSIDKNQTIVGQYPRLKMAKNTIKSHFFK